MIAQLEIELANYEVIVKHFNLYLPEIKRR